MTAVALADAHPCTSVVTLALIHPSSCVVHELLPRVSVEVAFLAVIVGRLVHRLDVEAAGEDQTSHGYALQSTSLPERKFHRDSFARPGPRRPG